MSRILITGGLGYVGGRVAAALASVPNYQVTVTTRTQVSSTIDWLPRARVISLDILSDEDCSRACQNVDTIIHLAAANEIDSGQDPQQALRVTGLGTLKLLQAAQQADVQRFIYFSTAHVYRAPLVGIIDETVIPRPAHPYSITHKTAEDFVLAAGDRTALKALVLRLSNGFGAPTHPDVNRWTLIANDLCRQAVTKQSLALRSSGLQQRDFITLKDIGQSVIHFLQPEVLWDDGVFNLGGANSLRIIDIAEMIQERCQHVLGFSPEIHRPAPSADEKTEVLDYKIDKLRQTKFSPEGNIAAEIDATLQLCQAAFGV